MHRIDTPTAQKDKFGAGKNGFTRGNPQTGTPATDLDDDYFDMLQEELAGVVEASGVNLEKSKHNQLLTALKALLLSRAHPFADIKADGAAAIAEALSNLGIPASYATTSYVNDNFAPLTSPPLSGIPTAPTAALGTYNLQLATTAFVQNAVNALVGAAPDALDTLKELADALGDDANFAGTVTTALAGKLNTSDLSFRSSADFFSVDFLGEMRIFSGNIAANFVAGKFSFTLPLAFPNANYSLIPYDPTGSINTYGKAVSGTVVEITGRDHNGTPSTGAIVLRYIATGLTQ